MSTPPPAPPGSGPSVLRRGFRFLILHELKALIRAGLAAAGGVRVVGEERVPRRGGFVVASNHTSFADPVVLQGCFPRHITYMMTDQYYYVPGLHPLLRFWGVLVVKEKGLNKEAIRAATEVLGRGGAIGIFPEGAISRDGLVHDAQPGAAMIAQRARVRVLPVGLAGVERLLPPDTWRLHRARVAICIGEPFSAEGQTRDDLTAEITRQIRACARTARDSLGS